MPKKEDDHALDEMRYYLMSRPKKIAPAAEKSDVLKEKERLWRKVERSRRLKGRQ